MNTEVVNEKQSGDGRGAEQSPQPMLRYADSAGVVHQEPVCERCLRKFKLSPERKRALQSVCEFHAAAEDYLDYYCHEVFGCYDRSRAVVSLHALHEVISGANGLYDCSLELFPDLRGSAYVSLAAGVLSEQDRAEVIESLSAIDSFLHHVRIEHHLGLAESELNMALRRLEEPSYCGEFGLKSAWRWAARFSGKTPEQIGQIFC